MKVKCVGIRSTVDQEVSLTPEMLAAVGARYSRNNEGLEAILSKIAGMDQEKAVDSIFNLIDYGHRSISDMAPIAMFMDDLSLCLILKLWQLCPTASGQESSTRYIKFTSDGVVKPQGHDKYFESLINLAFDAYNQSYDLWSQVSTEYPELLGLPDNLIKSTNHKDVLKVNRIKRNYAFDRARYYLPMCCKSNVMMIMNARGWVDLIKILHSDVYDESQALAKMLTEELDKVTPRLTKHACYDESYAKGARGDFERCARAAQNLSRRNTWSMGVAAYHEPIPECFINTPTDVYESNIVNDLMYHNNRYDYFGSSIKRTMVRFGWRALSVAELRDLNRHRTGTRDFDLIPVGSYFSDDQIAKLKDTSLATSLNNLRSEGERLTETAREKLASLDTTYQYYLPLGAQCRYEHTTTADKFLYQCELRTGLGSHYLYSMRMKEVLELWHQRFPLTRNIIRPGTAEPE